MVNAPNFPEGFRSGYELRGFKVGPARFPLSPGETDLIAELRGKLACVLAGCGFAEAAKECHPPATAASINVETIVQAVILQLQRGQSLFL